MICPGWYFTATNSPSRPTWTHRARMRQRGLVLVDYDIDAHTAAVDQ